MQPNLFDQMAAMERNHFWFRARRDILNRCLEQFLAADSENETLILDAGAGTGGNRDFLSAFGLTFGIDGSMAACRLAAEAYDGYMLQADLEQLPFNGQSFGLIALLDVLEHVDEQQKVLGELHRLLRPGGILLTTVPAYRHLWSGHDVVHGHRRRYLKTELRAELASAGFEIRYLSYFNTLLYPLVATVRLTKTLLKRPQDSDLHLPAPVVNRLLYRVFRLERLWTGKLVMPFGVSLVAVAAKRGPGEGIRQKE